MYLRNSVKPVSDGISMFKYVDDMSIVECRTSIQPSDMQGTLDELEDWCEQNQMKLNPAKCTKMEISFMRNPPDHPVVHIGDHVLMTVKDAKVLGVIIQNDLKWAKQVQSMIKRANSKLHMLRLLKRHGLPQQDLMTIYTSSIRPITEYAAPVWNCAITNNEKCSIERIQKRALRIMLGRGYTTYEEVLPTCGLVSLVERRESLCVSFITKTLKSTSQFRQLLPPENTSTRYSRRSKKYPEPCCKTTRMQNSAIPYLIRLLNSANI